MGKVMISIPDDFLKEIDKQAKLEHRARSELFREAIRFYFQNRRMIRIPREDPDILRAVELQDKIAAKDQIEWDSVSEIRKWRESK